LFRLGAGVHASNCSNSKFGHATVAADPANEKSRRRLIPAAARILAAFDG
jgi:hypothetical protein